jgi:hypothetical protein
VVGGLWLGHVTFVPVHVRPSHALLPFHLFLGWTPRDDEHTQRDEHRGACAGAGPGVCRRHASTAAAVTGRHPQTLRASLARAARPAQAAAVTHSSRRRATRPTPTRAHARSRRLGKKGVRRDAAAAHTCRARTEGHKRRIHARATLMVARACARYDNTCVCTTARRAQYKAPPSSTARAGAHRLAEHAYTAPARQAAACGRGGFLSSAVADACAHARGAAPWRCWATSSRWCSSRCS